MDPFKPYRQRTSLGASEGKEARPDFKGMMDRWEVQFRQLQIDYEKFFNGAETIPPETERNRLGAELRRLRNSRLSSAEQFRLGTLEGRFNSYSELFNRRQRQVEQGLHRAAARQAAGKSAGLDPRQGVTVGTQVESAAVDALYTGLSKGARPPKFDLDSFGKYLEHQATLIRQKTGCEKVQFRIEQDGDKMRLKAKPIRDQESQ
jgi:hypothetical protein